MYNWESLADILRYATFYLKSKGKRERKVLASLYYISSTVTELSDEVSIISFVSFWKEKSLKVTSSVKVIFRYVSWNRYRDLCIHRTGSLRSWPMHHWETVVGRNTFFSRPIIHDSRETSRLSIPSRTNIVPRNDRERTNRLQEPWKRCRNVGWPNLLARQGCTGKQYLRQVSDLWVELSRKLCRESIGTCGCVRACNTLCSILEYRVEILTSKNDFFQIVDYQALGIDPLRLEE